MAYQKDSAVSSPDVQLVVNNTISDDSPRKIFQGGSGGGPTVDAETKNYLDAKMDAVKAQNDARFSDVLARLDALNPATWWQNALLLAAAIGFVFAILAYASDRFDSGVNSLGAVKDSLDAQQELNASQDKRIDRILDALEQNKAQP